MPYYEEQMKKARSIDLLTYLQTYEPTELVNCFFLKRFKVDRLVSSSSLDPKYSITSKEKTQNP